MFNLDDIYNEQIFDNYKSGILNKIIKELPDAKQISKMFSEKEKNSVQLPFFSQEKTGYCWLIATLNIISYYVSKKYNCKPFKFSKNYLVFFDKIEKANYFLEKTILFIREDENEQQFSYLIHHIVSDRGQWQMAENLISKYGLIPGEIMEDSFATHNSKEINACLGMLLRFDAFKLCDMYKKKYSITEIREEKKHMLKDVVRILKSTYGVPPKMIKVPTEIAQDKMISPQEFYSRYIEFPFDEYISIYNSGEDKRDILYRNNLVLDGNIIEAKCNSFVSVNSDVFYDAILKQVREEGFCWTGCDSGKFHFKHLHVYDDSAIDVALFSPMLNEVLSKSVVNDYCIASMNHAVVLQNVLEIDNKLWWKALDSSIESEILLGYCYLSDSWISKYTFQAVIKKEYLPFEEEDIISKNMMPWEFFNMPII